MPLFPVSATSYESTVEVSSSGIKQSDPVGVIIPIYFFFNLRGWQKVSGYKAVADPGFPEGGILNPEEGGIHILFDQFPPKNCMKLKKFWPRWGGHMSLIAP